ncbi:hypothetical protein NFI95_09035 [Acetobacteraceae bacterium KSS8]|uniref:Uncharacterized protein n=1 Tax=Endosaccharibacter trunci TaxID=2812733 RepID=A0ABT1W884_9PROT|nr:hypothetical protein [Acetobacteraceae bacterium KSS8]
MAIEDQAKLEIALREFAARICRWSYGPTRSSVGDLLSSRMPLISPDRPNWATLYNMIVKKCKHGEDEIKPNIAVSKCLFDLSITPGWHAANFDMGRMPTSFNHTTQFWQDVVFENEHGLCIPCFDFRSTPILNSRKIRNLVYSLQNYWVRERHPDLFDAKLCIISVPKKGGKRTIEFDFEDDADLMKRAELNDRISAVYNIWSMILMQENAQVRKTGTGGTNPFNF